MKNEKITKTGIGRAYKCGLYFIEKRVTRFSDCKSIDEKVWRVKDPGVQICSASKIKQGTYGCSGTYYCIYSQITAQSDQSNQEFCKLQRNVNQQSGQNCTGRFSSKNGSWPKNKGKLKYLTTMTGCGSKSFHKCTITLSQKTTTANSTIIFLNQ